VQTMINLKTKGIILILVGAMLLSLLADARRIKDEEVSAFDIASTIVGSVPFYRTESIFFINIPTEISQDVAVMIGDMSGLRHVEDALIIDFKDLVEIAKKDIIERMRWKQQYHHFVIYGFYFQSEENGHSVDDVVHTMRCIRGWRNEDLEHNPLHIILSDRDVDFDMFTKDQAYNTPFINYLEYYEIVGGELRHPHREFSFF
jgi:hypothetical protein